MIPPLCNLLGMNDTKIIQVTLEALENILKSAYKNSDLNDYNNLYACIIDECGGLEKIESLQKHENQHIYKKALEIIEIYFFDEINEVEL